MKTFMCTGSSRKYNVNVNKAKIFIKIRQNGLLLLLQWENKK